jgi:hypothetical protein
MAPYAYSRNRKSIVNAAIAGSLLATWFWMLHGLAPQGCHFFHNVVWVAVEALRPVISAVWQSAQPHFCEGSSLLEHLLQVVASVRPLLWIIAG